MLTRRRKGSYVETYGNECSLEERSGGTRSLLNLIYCIVLHFSIALDMDKGKQVLLVGEQRSVYFSV